MWGNIEKYLPAESYKDCGFKTLTTNPCGEIPLSAYDSCRLVSINLKSFVTDPFTESAKFDFEKLEQVAYRAMRMSDDLIELEIEKLTDIINACNTEDERILWTNLLNACKNGRRTGLGTHGLADALACLRLPYDSAEALVVIDNIYNTIKESAYVESCILAQERGAFPVFDWEKEKDNAYIKSLPLHIRDMIRLNGRRNISILTNAPTGSVSIMSQTSSGLEPVFRNFYIRRRKLSHNEQDQIAAFVDSVGDKWAEYKVYHHNVNQYLAQFETDIVPDFFTESDKIDWKRRVEIQAIIQKHIDHSISSTINLPKGTSPDVVSELYTLGWKLGLKGITVYVDGSRDGVLITETKKDVFPQHNAPKRPQQLECDIHNLTVKGEKWTVLVGLLDGKPYEILGGANKLVDLPKSAKKGIIYKTPITKNKARYDLAVDELIVKDVVQVFDNANYSAFTRLLSLSLRHGAPINYVVEQLQKDETSDMFSFARCIGRVLKQYVPNGTKATGQKTCDECNSTELAYRDGCVSCTTCGWSKCG
jgi:ribonucleoside-diphosphate reductase alpha chain